MGCVTGCLLMAAFSVLAEQNPLVTCNAACHMSENHMRQRIIPTVEKITFAPLGVIRGASVPKDIQGPIAVPAIDD